MTQEQPEIPSVPKPETNGSKQKVAPPGLEDFFIHKDGGSPNIIREMTTTSTDPKEYIPRSIMDRNERAQTLRMYARHMLWEERSFDITELIWLNLACSIAIDGRGRKDAVEMYIGGAHRRGDDDGTGMMSKGRDANGNEIQKK